MEQKINKAPKFGYAYISWYIRNFYFLSRREEFEINSSTFLVDGFKATNWRLTLSCCKINKIDGCYPEFRIDLENEDYYSNLKTVTIRWNLWCDFPLERITLSDQEAEVKGGIVLKSSVKESKKFNEILQGSSSDTLKIEGYLFIRNDDHASVYKRIDDKGLKSLSEDIGALFVVQKLAGRDLFPKIGKQYLACHKAVLCARNKYIRDIVDKIGEHKDDFLLEHQNINGVRRVFKYLYSGNLEHVLRTPSLSIGKAIDYLSVRQLEMYYSKDLINLQTSFMSKEFSFKWNIIDITTRDDRLFLSPDFSDEMLKCTFRLYLDMKRESESLFTGIRLEFVYGEQPEILDVKFHIVSPDDDENKFTRTMRWSPERDGIENFFPKYFLNTNFVKDDNLSISFSACKFENIRNTVDISYGLHPSLNHEEHYQHLSDQLATLLETEKYSDFTIVCGEEHFKVHKCILLARTYFLRSQIKRQYTLTMNDFHPRILNFVLHHIYTGRLRAVGYDDLIKVYLAAKKLSMQSLRNLASQNLERCLEISNALEIYFLAIENKIFRLKEAAFLFIVNNIMEIREQDQWEILRSNYSLEYTKLLTYSRDRELRRRRQEHINVFS